LIGLAAAITAHLAYKVATIPALLIDIDYYSIASCILVLSFSFILSNSSIKHIPLSANTNAPPSNVHSLLIGSLNTLAVNPTADAPLPVVYTVLGNVYSTNFKNYDFAQPGSPNINTFMSPLILCLPYKSFAYPPNILNANAVLVCL